MTDYGKSSTEQKRIEQEVERLFAILGLNIQTKTYKNYVILDFEGHGYFCKQGFTKLPRAVSTLNSGQPWLLFWLLHTLELLQEPITQETKLAVIEYLKACKCPKTGAFCGGPYQLPHLAPTYAAVSALMILEMEEALKIIDVEGIKNFIISMKHESILGAFRMHHQGESDMRAIYCAISVASILGILDKEVTKDTPEFIARCQTYEGGLGGEPFSEAHGGFTYCGLASLYLMGKTHLVDLEAMLEWCVSRQMEKEGGFNGRTNKLVDSCYSFWIGGCFPILKETLGIPTKYSLYDNLALQAYILVACQSPMGLFDKPGSSPDYYHTAYSLGGLSLAQHCTGTPEFVFKESALELENNHFLFNVTSEKVKKAVNFFKNK